MTFDRNPRLVGSWTGRDFLSPLARFLLYLDTELTICPPQQPEKNAFIERYHLSYGEECLAIHQPQTRVTDHEVTSIYRYHYWERPNQAITCHIRPPRITFPDSPSLPPLSTQVDPDAWFTMPNSRQYRHT